MRILFFLICLIIVPFQNQQNDFLKAYRAIIKHTQKDNKDSVFYYGIKALSLAKQKKDKNAEGRTHIALGMYYYLKNESDTLSYKHYYKALRAYQKLQDTIKISKTLLRLSILEKNNKEFIKSKETSFKALSLLKGKSPKYLEGIHNNLGIVFKELHDLDKSITYYLKALRLRDSLRNQKLILQSYNNIATVYKSKDSFQLADLYYKKGLQYPDSILTKHPREYARLLDNYTHLNLLKKPNESSLLPSFIKALNIRKENNHKAGMVSSYLHLAEYYKNTKRRELSNTYALKAYELAYNDFNYGGVLKGLEFLKENNEKTQNFKKVTTYDKLYDKISKLIQEKESKVSEKFADIRYESLLNKRENKILKVKNLRQEKYLWIIIVLFILFALLSLLYVFYTRIQKQKRELEQNLKEQKAREEIAKLLLEQQELVEIAKLTEQQRISHDLHDSVEGKLSGAVLNLDTISKKTSSPVRERLEETISYIRSINQELRTIVYDMNQQRISSVSYADLLQQLLTNTLPQTIYTTLDIDDAIDWEKISGQIKTTCYYILHQATHNILKHAKATKTSVRCKIYRDEFHLVIVDDGIGIPENPNYRIGISGMKKRAKDIDGKIEIKSNLKKGTKILAIFPLS